MEDYIPGPQFPLIWFPHDGELQLTRRAHPGASHIQLAMAKDLPPQPNTHILNSLAL